MFSKNRKLIAIGFKLYILLNLLIICKSYLMYCSNCGNPIQETDQFCEKCGTKNSSIEKRDKIKKEPEESEPKVEKEKAEKGERQINDYIPEELRKAVKNAGDSVFALGIFSLIVTPIIYILSLSEEEDFTSLIIIILITTIVYAFFIRFGNKIRKDNLKDLDITLKNVSNTIIYSIIVFIFFILSGGWLGIFGIIMLIQLFKAKKLLKANI